MSEGSGGLDEEVKPRAPKTTEAQTPGSSRPFNHPLLAHHRLPLELDRIKRRVNRKLVAPCARRHAAPKPMFIAGTVSVCR